MIDALRERWDARGADAPLYPAMTFVGDALVLGAGTRLAATKAAGLDGADEAAPAAEARLAALLSSTHRRAVSPSALAYIRRAIAKHSEGETTLALIHLALSGLSKLERPLEDARRLFMADGLMMAGVEPRAILQALELDAGLLDEVERRYNPDQPRVPAGSGRESGQWTSGGAGEAPASDSATASTDRGAGGGDTGQAVQIADNSADWLQYLNPIGEAEAGTGRPAFNGQGPNDQHQQGVDQAIAAYLARGFDIETSGPTYVNVPGFPGPRVYDFVAEDPDTGELIGVEVKTTQYDAISLDPSQVDKDVALLENGGVDVPLLRGRITSVAYEVFCGGCWYINIRRGYLVEELLGAGVEMRFYSYPGGGPPI